MPEEYLPFFVYGTLLPDQPNYDLWQPAIQSSQPATFHNGRLLDLGHYPMLVETKEGLVHGQVITIQPAAYKVILNRLDHLEGYKPDNPEASEYLRKKRSVYLTDATAVAVWVYIGQARYTDHLPIVTDGNWLKHIQHKQQNSDDWWQNTHTVSGLHDDLN